MFGINDVDALVAEIVLGTGDLSLDVNRDGGVNVQDLRQWLRNAGDAQLPYGESYQFGDANLDGVVDAFDFITWNDNKFTLRRAWSSGDFNADGRVDGLDFILWNNNKFESAFDSVTAVPECTALGLWLMCLVGCGRRMWRS